MRRIWVVMSVVAVLVAALSGCSSSDDSPANGGATAKIGETCNATIKCAEGDCATAGFCTKSCSQHSDCGCPAGATDDDIANGACKLSCTANSCLKVCKTQDDCGTASCNATNKPYQACE